MIEVNPNISHMTYVMKWFLLENQRLLDWIIKSDFVLFTENKRLKNVCCVNVNQNKATLAILITPKINFKTKSNITDKESHHIMVNI